jgi:hypothetical protein
VEVNKVYINCFCSQVPVSTADRSAAFIRKICEGDCQIFDTKIGKGIYLFVNQIAPLSPYILNWDKGPKSAAQVGWFRHPDSSMMTTLLGKGFGCGDKDYHEAKPTVTVVSFLWTVCISILFGLQGQGDHLLP